ncbi:hypothetical protein LHYA1_G000752 [Lachnellula hyalina]|uniref:BTB domain-containing protein n=1 Tax=Lachnellula hyalina TaxID=1316788 RepID=A0A8H8U4A9_9HELO|nr:uncharacterized protein LHYA1_G000752 [Lachnellula hyalina]TVY30925.1 hypothetical protein LHYA1_G000752 [Lachnellula hyalina]
MNVSNKYASAYWNQELMGDLGSPELAGADTSSSISISLSIFPLQHIFSTWSLPFATDLVIPLTDQQISLSPRASTMTTKSISPDADANVAPKFGLELGIGMVDILVGPEQKAFRVHKHLLCTKVPYFHKMFNGGFKEASD